MPASPNVMNYTIGKGIVSIKLESDVDYRDIGNCPEFEFTPEIEKLEHLSSREGIKTTDRTEILSKKGTLRIVMEEITPENLEIALIGERTPSSSGQGDEIEIFSKSAVTASVKFVGTNDVGSKYTWIFNRVDFIPSSGINLISEEWLQVEISGDVTTVNGSFGTVTETADEETD